MGDRRKILQVLLGHRRRLASGRDIIKISAVPGGDFLGQPDLTAFQLIKPQPPLGDRLDQDRIEPATKQCGGGISRERVSRFAARVSRIYAPGTP